MVLARPARRLVEPALVAAALAALYLLVQPLTADHAAQEFRAELFAREGFSPWSNLWFGGHHLPGYSLLSPALGALVGPRLVGAIAAIAAAVLFAAIAKRRWGDDARAGILWFAAGTAISLFTGRTTFALGVALALAAVLAAQRERPALAIGFAALSPLASPVAALFLGLAGVVWWLAARRREGLALALPAVGVAAVVALAFPEGGSEPFVLSSFAPAFAIALAAFFLVPREERVLRVGVAAYALALLAAFAIDNPLGGNATRMGALLLGPLLACVLWRRSRLALALALPVLLVWQWGPVVRDLERAGAEPAVNPGFYEPLRDQLFRASAGEPVRVEVLPTVNHWESTHVPPRLTIARGWERQLDRELNPLFYDERLGALEYRRWLDRLGIGYVAVPDRPLDYSAESEAALIERRPDYLKPMGGIEHWDLYRVRDAARLATAPGELAKLSADGFVVTADRPGTSLVRLHHTPYWSVRSGDACVSESRTGFTRVRFRGPGRVRVKASFEPWLALSDGRSCGSAYASP
jgi:hypothetical protein